jgi:hypothetical protein
VGLVAFHVGLGRSGGPWPFRWALAVPVGLGRSGGPWPFRWALAVPVDKIPFDFTKKSNLIAHVKKEKKNRE